MAITLLRVSGIVLMLFGMGVMGTGLIEPRDLVGGIIFVAGFIDGLIIPKLLARKWRTPPGL
jgi:hypothetical protein